jgi:hypothetical protein
MYFHFSTAQLVEFCNSSEVQYGEYVSALRLFFRVPHAAPLALQFLLCLEAKRAEKKKNRAVSLLVQ